MAYDKNKLYKQALELCEDNAIFFIQDIIDSLCVGKTTFYTYFPDDSNELNTLKEKLYKNRIEKKKELRNKLAKGNGTELIALYKLIGNDEERKSLSTNWNENHNSGSINVTWNEERTYEK